jgi:hypothetical protein
MSAIPSTLTYTPAPNAARAEQYQTSLAPTNGAAFNGGTTVRFELPCGQSGMYLNTQQSYLSGAWTEIGGQNSQLPHGGASSCISVLSVYCGSELLSRTRNYAGVRTMFKELQTNRADSLTANAVLEGTGNADDRLGAAVNAGTSRRFCIPLFDATIGAQARHFPLGLVHSMRLELELVAPRDGVVSAGASTGFTLSDLEFRAQIIQLPAESERLVAASSGASTRSWNATQHAVYTDQLPAQAAETQVDMTIPARFSSCKSIQTFMTPVGARGVAANQATGRSKQNMVSYSYNLNGKRVPQREVNTRGDAPMAMAEVMRSLHAFGSVNTHSCIGSVGYNVHDTTDATGAFVVGTELESFSHRSDAIYSGASTLAVAPRFAATLRCIPACEVTHVVAHDAVYSIANGQCSVST